MATSADKVAKLRGEVARLTGTGTPGDQQDLDDDETRFSLLELNR